jgi:signal peptidase II
VSEQPLFDPPIEPVLLGTPNPRTVLNRRILFWGLMIGMLILDQVVKNWARVSADGFQGRTFLTLWPNVFELRLTYNEGIAFGWFQGGGVFLAPVAVAIAAGAVWYNLKHPTETKWAQASAALLAAGALGNLYDRLFQHRVTDMFYFRLIDFPVFNVADACITAAACMLIISWIREAMQPQQIEATVPVTETPATTAE